MGRKEDVVFFNGSHATMLTRALELCYPSDSLSLEGSRYENILVKCMEYSDWSSIND